jgi:hypothetical protein
VLRRRRVAAARTFEDQYEKQPNGFSHNAGIVPRFKYCRLSYSTASKTVCGEGLPRWLNRIVPLFPIR